MANKHPHCIYPLCGCAGTANCKADPLNTPLPCDVKVGGGTFRKGVKLGTFVEAARRWHNLAYPELATLTDEQKAENLAKLQGRAADSILKEWRAAEAKRKEALAALPPGTCGTCLGVGELGSTEGQRFIECPDCDGKGKTPAGVIVGGEGGQ
jgi:hypothetical protein